MKILEEPPEPITVDDGVWKNNHLEQLKSATPGNELTLNLFAHSSISENCRLQYPYLLEACRIEAIKNHNTPLEVGNRITGQHSIFHFPKGIDDFAKEWHTLHTDSLLGQILNREQKLQFDEPIRGGKIRGLLMIDHLQSSSTSHYYTIVNSVKIIQGIHIKALNRAKKAYFPNSRLFAVIEIELDQPIYNSPTKSNLTNKELHKPIYDLVKRLANKLA